MTRGKKALSDIPRNHLMASSPPKLKTATTRTVHRPNVSIMHGNTIFGPYFLPNTARNGAVKT